MKPRKLILLFVLNLSSILLFLLYSSLVDCARITKRQGGAFETFTFPPNNEFSVINNAQVHRQGQFLPTIFNGPLALAAFLFAIPLIPQLLMAPLAVAGLPSAFNVFNSVVSGLTNGKPLQQYILPFTDPLYNMVTSSSANQSDIIDQNSNQPIRRQLNMLRSFAKTFRTVINKRYSITPNHHQAIQDNNPLPEVIQQDAVTSQPDKYENEIEELINNHKTSTSNLTSSNNNDENISNSSNNVGAADILNTAIESVSQMEKSIRGMDVLYNSLRDIYSVIRNGLRRYEITDTECQSRIVCEIHQKIINHNKLLKTFSLNALEILNLEKQIDSWSSLNQKSKESIKFYINAARVGFADKDCNKEFRNCPTLNMGRSLRRMIIYRYPLLKLI